MITMDMTINMTIKLLLGTFAVLLTALLIVRNSGNLFNEDVQVSAQEQATLRTNINQGNTLLHDQENLETSMDTAANDQAPPQAPLVQITNQQLTDQALEIYIQDGLFHPDITEVELPSNQITVVGLRALLDSPIESLQVLNLYDNQIGDVGAQVIATSEKLAGVIRLDLAYNAISLEGINALFGQGSILTGPVWINLAGNEFGDEGLVVILNSYYINTLNGLVLRRTGLTDTSAIALSQTSSWQNLQYLDLSGNMFTESGRNMIIQNPSLKGVEVVFE